ncbi:MAG: type II toxin-antitoxin system VapC family toxin [Terracidiphilus sp.]
MDTNVLLRAAVRDDPQQAISAAHALRTADLIAVPVAALCEFVWGMRSAYKKSSQDVARSIRSLVSSPNVVTNHPVIEAGLAVLDKGGDFADGAIAYEGEWLGAEEFVSFDEKAVKLLKARGKRARLLV